uniref:SFRICE_019043 n=1 Tax=Spodoptera frugiperda TaxID=7108 RepID=A0A2H1V805_SPOFR
MQCQRAHICACDCIQSFCIEVPALHPITMISLFFILLVAVTYAAAQAQSTPPIPIVRFESDGPNPDGSYKWLYETGNEINAEESGYVKNFGQGEGKEIQTAEGKFSYKAPDGSLIALTYIADENGFQPQGDHLPTPPPIPPAIAKALEYLKTLPPGNNEGASSNIKPQFQAAPFKARPRF